MEACCCQPIDVIKTRLQLDHAGKYTGKHVFHQRASLATCNLGQQVKYLQVSSTADKLSSRKRECALYGRA